MKLTRKVFKCEVPSMAMGDIAFNLLVFFVILAKAQDDSHLQWQPATTAKVESAGNTHVSIVVDKDNKLYLNGKEVGVEQLSAGITDILKDAQPGDRTVLLKIHKETLAQAFSQSSKRSARPGATWCTFWKRRNSNSSITIRCPCLGRVCESYDDPE